MSTTTASIKPPLTFRVGIVGHRPKRLPVSTAALQARLHELLVEIKAAVKKHHGANKELYAPADEPILRALSPLSEGADRLFADAATQAGCELFGVFPFPADDYNNDFADSAQPAVETSAQRDFQRRLNNLPRFEMDGVRLPTAAEDRSYRNAGLVVNRQSDILIVVWDGDHRGKVGGTEESMEAALRDGVPVIWVDAHGAHDWRILKRVADIPRSQERDTGIPKKRMDHMPVPGRHIPLVDAKAQDLQTLVHRRLQVPEKAHATQADGHEHTSKRSPRQEYIRFITEQELDRNRTWHGPLAWLWSVLKGTIGKGKAPSPFKDPYWQSLKREWPMTGHAHIDAWSTCTLKAFAHADQLSIHYSERYRGTYIFLFLAGAIAVLCAVLPMALGLGAAPPTGHGGVAAHGEHGLLEKCIVAMELFMLILILLLWPLARRHKWQERWLDYRIVAELLRQMRYVTPLGGRRLLPRMGGHLSGYGDPANTWMAWYVRAWERAVGLPSVVVDQPYLDACQAQVSALAADQQGYHAGVETTYERIEHRLHTFSIALGFVTVVACGLHLWGVLNPHAHDICPMPSGHALVFICAFFPALAAALAGINNQGEFKRAAMRSRAMEERLRDRRKAIDQLQPSQPGAQRSPQLADQASALTELMSQEAMGWRVIFTDRPVVPPT